MVSKLFGGVPNFEQELVGRHEHIAGANQGRGRKALVLRGFDKIEHAVVERVIAR